MAERWVERPDPKFNGVKRALFALCILAAACATRSALDDRGARREVRALWVVRTSLTSAEAIEKLVADARAGGINTLVVQVRGRGDAYYRSHREPRASALRDQPAGFDPLALVVARGHAAGIRVHAWINTHLVANLADLPVESEHVFVKHPEWLAVPRKAAEELLAMDARDPRYVARIIQVSREDLSELEGLYTSPAHPAVQDHIAGVFRDVAQNYDVDGVHFDYVRYPSPAFDYNRTAVERFRKAVEPTLGEAERSALAALAADHPLVYTERLPAAWDQFRRDQITALVARISREVKAVKPRLQVTAAVFANDEDAFFRRFQDWKSWLEQGFLDAVCPMAYTADTDVWKRQIAVARGYSFGRQVWAGIGAYRQSPDCALEKIRLARRIGVDGVIFFSYGQMTGASVWAPEGDYLRQVSNEAFR